MKILIAIILNAIALLLTALIVPGFMVANFFPTAVLAAIVLGVVNTFIRPFLLFLTAPLNLLTLGLFTFVINAVMLWLVSAVVTGVTIDGWVAAVLAAIVLSVVSTILSMLVGDLKLNKKIK